MVLVYSERSADGTVQKSGADGVQITTEDLQRLDPNEFLNDSIIDFYIK